MILPLLYLRKMAIVRGQILFSALVVKAGSTVQTIQRVSMTKVRTSELNWAASCTSPSKTLGRNGCRTCVLSDSLSWSQYLWSRFKERSLFLWKSWYFSQDYLITKEFKIAAFIWNINLYYTLVNVITIILDQFNASLLYYKKRTMIHSDWILNIKWYNCNYSV